MHTKTPVSLHNQYAPYWAAAMITLVVIGLLLSWLKPGGFWKAYVLDMVGPAWNYILVRGLFTAKAENIWTRFFKPTRTILIILAAAFTIESIQYFNLYDSTFDPWDFLAYSSILIPVYLIDRWLMAMDKPTISR